MLNKLFSHNLLIAVVLGLLAAGVPHTALAAEGTLIDSGDTAWIISASVLVLFMTIPGLSLFYAGLVRAKNVLSIMMQNLAVVALITVLWIVYGYSVAFGGSPGLVIGGFEKTFLNNVDVGSVVGTIPETVFMFFQLTFAIITPALIIGAFAERMKFSAFLGKRKGYPTTRMPANSVVLTMVGAAMLWVGWFGFNAGSGLAADGVAGMAATVTQIATATATLTWMFIEWSRQGKPSGVGLACGAVAGLVAITPASGYVGPVGALAIGFAASAICYWAVYSVKSRFGYDDALDVFGVHGVGGFVGAIMTGVFASVALGGSISNLDIGQQLGLQAIGAFATLIYSGIVTFVILKIVDAIVGLRVSEQEEDEGLDLSLHGEEGFNL